jgi:asparagine synthase (glutamine-hydrolysing)
MTPGAAAWVVRWDTRGDRAAELSVDGAGRDDLVVAPLGSGGFAVLDGVPFHRAQLGPPGATTAALLAGAWERWGDALADKLRGAFALVIWDGQARRLLAGRDAAGLVPCFYVWDAGRLSLSSSVDTLLAEPGASARFNREALAEYLLDSLPAQQVHETFHEAVRRLPPAHTLAVSGGRLELARYWDPLPSGFRWARGEEAAQFGPLLEQAVGRCLDAGADSLALSGGFDSIGLAVVAAGQRGAHAPLHAISLRFADPACDEIETQRAVARALGMPQTIGAVGAAFGTVGLVDGVLGLSRSSPSPVLSPWQALYVALLRSAAGQGLRRLLMGTGGDELLNVDVSHGADRLLAGDVAGLWRLLRACQRTSPYPALRVARAVLWSGAALPALRCLGRDALRRLAPGTLDRLRHRRHRRSLPPWLAPDQRLAAAIEERCVGGARPVPAEDGGQYVAALRSVLTAPLTLLEQDQGHAWAARAGFRLMLPYFDRDLLDLGLRLHPDELIAGGRLKSPLRQLVAERLPQVPLPQRKVDFQRMFHGVVRPHGRAAWRSMGGARVLADLGIVDPGGLDRMMNRYFEGADHLGMSAWTVLSTELWVRARSGEPAVSHTLEVPA